MKARFHLLHSGILFFLILGIELHCGAGVKPNADFELGEHTLIWASRKGKLLMLQLLTQYGGDVHITDEHGKSVLTWAAIEGYFIGIMRLYESC